MPPSSLQVCSVCGVQIAGGDRVLFATGAPGTRSRLWARVCQYAKKSGCINQDQELIGAVKEEDHYKPI